jgi:hypothetical protein
MNAGALLEGFFNSGLVQPVLGAAFLAVLGWVVRTWIRARSRRLWGGGIDLRVTRNSTVEKRIETAVSDVRSEVQRQLDQQAEAERERQLAWVMPTNLNGLSEEERAIARDEQRHAGQMKDQWTTSTDRSRERHYVLRNVNARTAKNVRVVPILHGAFEVISGPPGDTVENGAAVPLEGRISDPSLFEPSAVDAQFAAPTTTAMSRKRGSW